MNSREQTLASRGTRSISSASPIGERIAKIHRHAGLLSCFGLQLILGIVGFFHDCGSMRNCHKNANLIHKSLAFNNMYQR